MRDIPLKDWFALIGLSLLSFTAFLDYTIVATALPFIQTELHATVLQLQWVMSIMSVVLCMFLIISGQIGDLFGRRKIFFGGFLIFGCAALGAALSPTIQWLIFFRALQGFSAGIIFTLGVALLPQAFPPTKQNLAIGFFSAFNGAGLAIGPFLGGILISSFNWRSVFWVNIPIIVVGLLMSAFTLKNSQVKVAVPHIDVLGVILLIVGMGCFMYGIINCEQSGWDNLITVANLSIGIVSLILLFVVESRITHPLLDFKIFHQPLAVLAMLVCIAAGVITSVFLFFDPLYLKLIRKESALSLGLILLAVPFVQIIISLCLDFLIRHLGIVSIIIFALLSGTLAAFLHCFFQPASPLWFILLGLMLMGYTWGIANAGSIAAMHSATPPERLGATIGTIFTFWNISGALSLALATVLFHWRISISHPRLDNDILEHISNGSSVNPMAINHFMSGYHWVAACSTIFMLFLLIIALKFRKK